MLNYPNEMAFSPTYCFRRVERACELLGEDVVKRIIGYALFLLGGNREEIARYLEVPFGTFLSFLTRTEKSGLAAFEDQRENASREVQKKEEPFRISLQGAHRDVEIELESGKNSLYVPAANLLQSKIILLTFLSNGLLSVKETSEALGFSERHTRELKTKLNEQDVYALIDKRKGQLKDYRFTPDIKAELIQQFAANAICGKRTSSRIISEQINKRCSLQLSDRSIRFHVKKMGLANIVHSLPQLVATLKKTPHDATEGTE